MQSSVTITMANAELVSVFLLNCDRALFKTTLSTDSVKQLHRILNEKYRIYVRLLLCNADLEREEKVKQIAVAVEDMIAPANQSVAELTTIGLQQLHAILNKNNRATKKASVSQLRNE
jgi:hypothetical protein